MFVWKFQNESFWIQMREDTNWQRKMLLLVTLNLRHICFKCIFCNRVSKPEQHTITSLKTTLISISACFVQCFWKLNWRCWWMWHCFNLIHIMTQSDRVQDRMKWDKLERAIDWILIFFNGWGEGGTNETAVAKSLQWETLFWSCVIIDGLESNH